MPFSYYFFVCSSHKLNKYRLYRYTNQGADTEKTKSATIEMTDVDHYKALDGSVYASVKGKSGNVNGAIDNANFVADSYGAYDPVNGEPEKKKVKDFEYDSELEGYVVYDSSTLLSVSAPSTSFDERLDSFCVISRV